MFFYPKLQFTVSFFFMYVKANVKANLKYFICNLKFGIDIYLVFRDLYFVFFKDSV